MGLCVWWAEVGVGGGGVEIRKKAIGKCCFEPAQPPFTFYFSIYLSEHSV